MSTGNTGLGQLKSNVRDVDVPIKIHREPSLSSDFVSRPSKTQVTILDLNPTSVDAEGFVWYPVQYDGTQTGFVRDDVIEILPGSVPPPVPPPDVDPSPEQTRVYFETAHRQVRVYEDRSSIFMNVYNKQANVTEVNHVAAAKLPANLPFEESYLTIQSGRSYQASFRRLGATHLRITESTTGQDIEPIESGFKAYGTEYQTQ